MLFSRSVSALLLVGVLAVSGCANLPLEQVYAEPEMSYQSTSIRDVSFSELTGTSIVSIKNPNPYALPISSLGAELMLEGEPLLALDNNALDGLPASKSVPVSLNWNLVFNQLLQRASDAYAKGEAQLAIALSPTVQVPLLGARQLEWSSEFTVPVPKPPSVKIAGWDVGSMSFSSIELLLDVDLKNPNVFSVNTEDLNVGLKRNGQSLGDLRMLDAQLPAGQSTRQQLALKLPLLSVGTSVVSALRSGQWPNDIELDWQGDWSSPDLGFDLPSLAGELNPI